jgi:gas vesicle protein
MLSTNETRRLNDLTNEARARRMILAENREKVASLMSEHRQANEGGTQALRKRAGAIMSEVRARRETVAFHSEKLKKLIEERAKLIHKRDS